MKGSKTSRALSGLLFFLCILVGRGVAETPVFLHGQVLLPVIVAADASPEEREAATDLGRVLGKMSGLSWPILNANSYERLGMYVGHAASRAGDSGKLKVTEDIFSPKPGECGPDAFRVESRDGSVFIEGATPEATGFAVAWLLQHEGGVRWYAPGPVGEVIPRRTEWSLPELHITREPAYISREITGLQTEDEKTWARHNGFRSHLEFSHALGSVFPAVLAKDHPDWFPILNGARYWPSSPSDNNWQPSLALPAVAEYAGQIAATAFAADGGRLSFSLGINDTVRFDQSEATQTLVEPLHYFRGMPDYSPLVFTFMNRAAESLSRSYPNRYLGGLAYFWCENPPAFPVHRNVLPYVTTDRSQYYDREYRAADLALMSRWGASGVRAYGLWDYAYGRGFVIPRITLGALADSVREGWHRGARGYFAEVGPQWGFDAFKVWMLAQLLWEPDRPVEELTADFYNGYYSAAAAPMRSYFTRSEEQWMTQGGTPYWLKYYRQEDQALLFPAEVCRELRGLLEVATQAVKDNPAAAAHVAQTSRAFAVTETYVQFDALRRAMNSLTEENLQKEEGRLSALIANLMKAQADFRNAFNAVWPGESPATTDAELFPLVRNDPVLHLLWLSGLSDATAPLRILQRAGLDASKWPAWFALSEILASGTLSAAPNLIANSSFAKMEITPLEPRFLYPNFDRLPAKWKLKAMPTEQSKVQLIDSDAPGGERAVRIEGAWDTQLYQWIPVEPDCTYIATAKLRGKSSPGNDSGLFLAFLNATGAVMDGTRMQLMPKGIVSDSRIAVLAGKPSEGAIWVGIGIGSSHQSPGDWLEATAVELRGVVENRNQ